MGIAEKKEKKELDKQAAERLNNGTLFYLRSVYKKILEDLEGEEKENYNVGMYQVGPYPPNTKNLKDFFIQRT